MACYATDGPLATDDLIERVTERGTSACPIRLFRILPPMSFPGLPSGWSGRDQTDQILNQIRSSG
jgi:hypothetical protein